jgi:hypothetical protein
LNTNNTFTAVNCTGSVIFDDNGDRVGSNPENLSSLTPVILFIGDSMVGGFEVNGNETMAAYDMFQRYCNRPEDSTTSTTTSTTTAAPKPDTNVVVPAIPVIPILPSTNLGIRPMGGGGGGGSEDAAPVEKKKSYWWLLLVALGIYLVAKKKKD